MSSGITRPSSSILESSDFEKALDEKLLDYDDFTMRILKSTKSNKPKYSEIFMDTPFGVGSRQIGRRSFLLLRLHV